MAAATNTANTTPSGDTGTTAEEAAAKAVNKRYEGLVMVRNKAVKGKGAWYWAHLEPLLVHNTETGLPKAVKLRCSLCDAVFSASNPSRTASEHLKRGTCPNFNSSVLKPISSVSPTTAAAGGGGGALVVVPPSSSKYRKRNTPSTASFHIPHVVPPLATVDLGYSSSSSKPHLVLSGGKDDLGALAMLEDSVKKLKSPKASPGPTLSKAQIDNALEFLSDWVYESCGSVSFSSLEHPKFRAFLNQVGLPAVSPRELTGVRLDQRFAEAKAESEAKIRDAMFFQIASDGWRQRNQPQLDGDDGGGGIVNLTVNLPNGTSLYRKAVFIAGSGGAPSNYAEEVLLETVTGICGNLLQKCVGIVADRFKSKALKNLENQNQWMVNLSCQYQAFKTLIKDFTKELPLFKTVTENCLKITRFINYTSNHQIRNSFHKYQMQEYGHTWLLRLPPPKSSHDFFSFTLLLLEDTLNSARAFQLTLIDESFKIEDQDAREFCNVIRDVEFWNDLEAVHDLVKLVKEMAHEIESERPLVGQCLPLWHELRSKVKDWCSKFHIAAETASTLIEKIIDGRFRKNYHPAWSAAYILDPLYLIKDTSGKYLPPFKHLSQEQEKDVDKLITRLVSRDEAHIALMELMKWRTEGLDPVYAQAVQMKERDAVTGKMRIVNPQSSRLVWETYLTEFKSLGKVAVRLIFLNATSCGFKCNWSLWRWVCAHEKSKSTSALEKVQKLMFIAAHSKLERREFSCDEDKDAELFAFPNGGGGGEDDVLNQVLV